MKDKPITTYEELREFVIAVVYAMGEISKVEAEVGINKAFVEYKTHFNKLIKESIDAK